MDLAHEVFEVLLMMVGELQTHDFTFNVIPLPLLL